ncbi:M15 family metallopeptidase [Intrasporangium sp.]|uniref:M15 family metallopeptidase n=1 Tax=Intrasporangium sp. TaxID=1925024 RepID=UPI003365A0B5
MPPLLADPLIRDLGVVDDGSRLVDLRDHGLRVVPTAPPLPLGASDNLGRMPLSSLPSARVLPRLPHVEARETVAERLVAADACLPHGVRLLVVEGLRLLGAQIAIHDAYRRRLATAHPDLSDDEIAALTSRFVAPPSVGPHVSGAAVDVTLVGPDGPLDLGTAIDATPEQSGGACYFDSAAISSEARHNRSVLATVLGEAGLVNYPTEWWHWSFGDRYWAHVTGRPFAIHGPIHPRNTPGNVERTPVATR